MSGFPDPVLRALKRRSHGICEACGVSEAMEAHHRQYRSRGGPDTLANALHLCGMGNLAGCHGIAHTAKGEALGWSIRSGYDPLIVPVLIVVDFTRVWMRLVDEMDGAPTVLRAADAVEYLALIGARKDVA